jgi:hypothetical protein
MSERDDEVEFTTRVLESAGVAGDGAGERAEIERAAQEFRLALRNTDVAGLDASMREAILRRAERRSRVRTWPLVLAAAMGGAVVAVLALYFGVMIPAQQAEAARVERERVAEQQVAAQRERQAEERIRAAQREVENAKQAAAVAAHQAWVDSSAAREPEPSPSARGGGVPDGMGGRAGKSSAARVNSGSAGKASGDGCDPNDPLCGF